MPTYTQGYTFSSNEKVTSAKLHQLVTGMTAANLTASQITSGTFTDSLIPQIAPTKITGTANRIISTFNAGQEIAVDGTTLEVSADTLKVKDNGIGPTQLASSLDLSGKTITYPANQIQTSHIANLQIISAKLADSSVITNKVGYRAVTNSKLDIEVPRAGADAVVLIPSSSGACTVNNEHNIASVTYNRTSTKSGVLTFTFVTDFLYTSYRPIYNIWNSSGDKCEMSAYDTQQISSVGLSGFDLTLNTVPGSNYVLDNAYMSIQIIGHLNGT